MLKTSKPRLWALGIAVLVLSGCNANPFSDTPGDVVKKFYKACNQAQYSDARKYITHQLASSELLALAGGMKGACDSTTKNGTLDSVHVVSVIIRGEGAEVITTDRFRDGSIKRNDKTSLVKEDGSWRINQ